MRGTAQDGVKALRVLAGHLERRGELHADAGIVQEAGAFLVQQLFMPVNELFARFPHNEAGLFPLDLVHQGKQGESQAKPVQEKSGLVGPFYRGCRHGCGRFIASMGKTGRHLHAVTEKKMEAVPFPEFKKGTVRQVGGS